MLRHMKPTSLLLPVVFCLSPHALADLALPRFFSDHMVLQRDKPAAVWGTADAGATVTVTFKGKAVKTKADGKGAWKARLGPFSASAEGAALTISDGKDTKSLNDVLVGEVWFASGQSNMQWNLAQSGGAKESIAAASQPGIRFFMTKLATATEPQADTEGAWVVSSPQSAGRFSGVGYHFALNLHQELGVPVGVIQSAWGGKPVETFTSREALASVPEGKARLASFDKAVAAFDPSAAKTRHEAAIRKWKKQMEEWKSKPKETRGKAPAQPKAPENPSTAPGNPATIYNAMVAPFVGYAMRGAIWYQGESNAKSPQSSLAYGKLFPLMIHDWRVRWHDDFRFLWVQLANFRKPVEQPGTNDPWAILQDQQRRSLAIERTGMAVINDIGTENNIHPPNKKDVGQRLARWALADDYGKDVVKCGPLFKGSRIDGAKVTLAFEHTGKGLKSADGGPLKRFEIRGEDGTWHWADATISAESVVVSSPEVAKPAAVRYAWAANPTGANLVNSEGLPASVFTTE